LKNVKKLKEMLSGVKISFRMESIRILVFTPEVLIMKEQKELANLDIEIGMLGLFLNIVEENIIAKVLLREIKMIDYFKPEALIGLNNKLFIDESFRSDDKSMIDGFPRPSYLDDSASNTQRQTNRSGSNWQSQF